MVSEYFEHKDLFEIVENCVSFQYLTHMIFISEATTGEMINREDEVQVQKKAYVARHGSSMQGM